jgi:hypothetical protein
MYRTAVELIRESSWNFMLESIMKNVPSYFNFNSDHTVLTSTSLEAVNMFLRTCAVPVQPNWSTVARMRQNCKVWSTTLLEEQTCCMMHTFPNLFLMYWTLRYVHFAEMVPSRLGSLPGPPPMSYFHLSLPNKNFYSLYHTHCRI